MICARQKRRILAITCFLESAYRDRKDKLQFWRCALVRRRGCRGTPQPPLSNACINYTPLHCHLGRPNNFGRLVLGCVETDFCSTCSCCSIAVHSIPAEHSQNSRAKPGASCFQCMQRCNCTFSKLLCSLMSRPCLASGRARVCFDQLEAAAASPNTRSIPLEKNPKPLVPGTSFS